VLPFAPLPCYINAMHMQEKSGIVAVVGRTNVGKSSMVNAIIGEKVCIVSPSVQTTRNQIRGILSEERGQLVLIDTPGVHKAVNSLGQQLNKMARAAVGGSDMVVLVLDASAKPWQEDEGWMRRLLFVDQPCAIVLNKCDVATPEERAAYRQMWTRVAAEKESDRTVPWFEISARTGEGMDVLIASLFDALPAGPPLFPAEIVSDYPRRLAVADSVREKLLLRLKEEVPHHVAVWVDEIAEKPGEWAMDVTIYVNRKSQKGIVIGAKGRILKAVRAEAEKELSDAFQLRVKLHLWVKVEPNWLENFFFLKRLGYA
jgi:GTP-binding protein Era